MAGAYPEEDAPALAAREIVEGLVKHFGPAATLADVRAQFTNELVEELQRLEFDARTDERAECAQIVAQVFPPAHPARRDAEEAIRRIRVRDTQP